MPAKAKGRFIEPMLLLRTDRLPNDGDRWEYELKFTGYRAIAFKTGGKLHLRSRNDNDFSLRYADVVKGLAKLPDETVIDGEVIALDEDGRPSFNMLQNYGSSKAPVLYFVFDVMILAGRDVMKEPLEARRELLEKKILPKVGEPVRYAAPLGAPLPVRLGGGHLPERHIQVRGSAGVESELLYVVAHADHFERFRSDHDVCAERRSVWPVTFGERAADDRHGPCRLSVVVVEFATSDSDGHDAEVPWSGNAVVRLWDFVRRRLRQAHNLVVLRGEQAAQRHQ
jgi:hypothetical protein